MGFSRFFFKNRGKIDDVVDFKKLKECNGRVARRGE